MKKRLLSIAMALLMALSLLPAAAMADGPDSWEECAACSESSPHMISTPADLDRIRTHTNILEDGTTVIDGWFKLACDIEFTDADFQEGGAFYNEGQTWIPIGHTNETGDDGIGEVFCGHFNGDGHSIKNLKMLPNNDNDETAKNMRNRRYCGVFMMLGGEGVITNTVFEGISNSTKHAAGIPVGNVVSSEAELSHITITDCEIIPAETSNNGLAPSLISQKLMGDVHDITVKNCRYCVYENGTETEGAPWYATMIAARLEDARLSNITVTGCEFYIYDYSNLLFSYPTGVNTAENITITDTKWIATHRESGRDLVGVDANSAKGNNLTLKDVTIDIFYEQEEPPLDDYDGVVYEMIPDGLELDMDNVSLQFKLGENTPMSDWWYTTRTLARYSDQPISVECTDAEENVFAAYLDNGVYYVTRNDGKLALTQNVEDVVNSFDYVVTDLTATGGDSIVISPEDDSDTTEPAALIRDGFIFDGWYAQYGSVSGVWGEEVTNPGPGKMYYAKWSESAGYDVAAGHEAVALTVAEGDVSSAARVNMTLPEGGSITGVIAENGDVVNATAEGASVSIRAAVGLQAGTYAETLYVCTGDGATHWIDVTLTVEDAEDVTPPDEPDGRPSWSVPTRYTVSVEDTDNGGVRVNPTRAGRGQTVTITVQPDEGFELDCLTITDSDGDEISVRDLGDGRYDFTMPRSDVTVEAGFAEIETEPLPVFIDVPEGAYYHDAVYWAVEQGVTNGTGEDSFTPGRTVTRAEMVTFLWRAYGRPEPESGVNPFTDVPDGAYYHDAVLWAVENGITNGTGDTTFSPDAAVSRAQAVTFQWRAAGSPSASGGSFSDVPAGAYYAGAVSWAVANGITNGTGGNKFSPEAGVSRAQAVTFLYREP